MTAAEREEAVAVLRRAAELVVDGAEVAPNRGEAGQFVEAYAFAHIEGSPINGKVGQVSWPRVLTPAEARRKALHLLVAAEEADAAAVKAMQP